MRITAAAPNALHEPSVFGSHAIAIANASRPDELRAECA
jgi:hypothetical protein